MGRKPTRNLNLPPRLRARRRKSGIYYFYDHGGKPRRETPLGSDFVAAVREWSKLEEVETPRSGVVTFNYAADQYIRKVLPTKAPATQEGNLKELVSLREFFGDPPAALEKIQPVHIKQYLSWRIEKARARLIDAGKEAPLKAGAVRANREIALFSHIFNFAREEGLTAATNPCAGVSKHAETGRDTYIEDDLLERLYAHAEQPLRDAVDLAYLAGQRPADTLAFDERHIRDGMLHVGQGKTGKKLRISIGGELHDVIERIRARKRGYTVVSTALIVTEDGQRVTARRLRSYFDKARARAEIPKRDFQFRDLRAKAGTDKTDAGDIRQAQKQLGHNSVTMTERYVRNRRGDKVTPTR